jgi:hypothetical protein
MRSTSYYEPADCVDPSGFCLDPFESVGRTSSSASISSMRARDEPRSALNRARRSGLLCAPGEIRTPNLLFGVALPGSSRCIAFPYAATKAPLASTRQFGSFRAVLCG